MYSLFISRHYRLFTYIIVVIRKLIKTHSHRARLRPSTSVYVRPRAQTQTLVYADMEHMGKGLRVHTKSVDVHRRT